MSGIWEIFFYYLLDKILLCFLCSLSASAVGRVLGLLDWFSKSISFSLSCFFTLFFDLSHERVLFTFQLLYFSSFCSLNVPFIKRILFLFCGCQIFSSCRVSVHLVSLHLCFSSYLVLSVPISSFLLEVLLKCLVIVALSSFYTERLRSLLKPMCVWGGA